LTFQIVRFYNEVSTVLTNSEWSVVLSTKMKPTSPPSDTTQIYDQV